MTKQTVKKTVTKQTCAFLFPLLIFSIRAVCFSQLRLFNSSFLFQFFQLGLMDETAFVSLYLILIFVFSTQNDVVSLQSLVPSSAPSMLQLYIPAVKLPQMDAPSNCEAPCPFLPCYCLPLLFIVLYQLQILSSSSSTTRQDSHLYCLTSHPSAHFCNPNFYIRSQFFDLSSVHFSVKTL